MSAQILSGQKTIHNLSTVEREVLDGMVHSYNGASVSAEPGVPAELEAPDVDAESDSGPVPGAYGWLGEG